MSLLSVESVYKSYFNNPVLKAVTLCVNPGDRIGLIGENGSGKTTLFRIITGRETADSGTVVVAANAVVGYLPQEQDDPHREDADALYNRELSKLESLLRETERELSVHSASTQDPKYREFAARYAMLHDQYEAADGYSHERRMREALYGLGLSEDICSLSASSLSGGEKMTIALARLMIARTDLLLLDEPTNHLDISAVEWLEEELVKYRGGVIVISHDRFFLDRVTTATAGLENGGLVVRSGNYSSFIHQKRIETDFAEKEHKRLTREIERQSRIRQTMLSHRNITGYHEREKRIDKLSRILSEKKATARTSQQSGITVSFLKGNPVGNAKKVLLRAAGLSKKFGNRLLFSAVSFELLAEDKVFIVGPNGCGKSTLLSLFLGDIEDFEGSVKLAQGLTFMYMGQNVVFEREDRTLLEEITQRLELTSGEAKGVLAEYAFTGTDVSKTIAMLSGGERSRLYLACALRKQPDLLVLDEPTNHLDIASREIFEDALKSFSGAFIAVSHDRYFLERCADKIWGFDEGTLREYSSYKAYRSHVKERTANAPKNKLKPIRQDQSALNRKSRAFERQLSAKNKAERKALEEKIRLLEEEKEALEKSFSEDTRPEEYHHYSNLLQELEEAYLRYVEQEL